MLGTDTGKLNSIVKAKQQLKWRSIKIMYSNWFWKNIALYKCFIMFWINREAVVSIKMFKIRKAKDEEPTAPGQGK